MSIKNPTLILLTAAAVLWPAASVPAQAPLRPPAVPLVTHDPYFSVWSTSDKLMADWPRHWTGAINAMAGHVRIDGKTYAFMGQAPKTPPMEQKSVTVSCTASEYRFAADGVELTARFLSPLLVHHVDLAARPLSYITFSSAATDGKPHEVQLYFDVTGEWVVDKPTQPIGWSRVAVEGLTVARMGTAEQPVLKKVGDNRRIDWGYLHLAAPKGASLVVGADKACRESFAASGKLPAEDDTAQPRPANDRWPVMATVLDLPPGKGSQTLMLAYDDIDSIEFLGKPLKAWWKKDGTTIATLLSKAAAEREAIATQCAEFDREFAADMVATGGEKFAALGALAYRQATAAQKIVAGPDGQPWMFEKECFSNGCIATVDVIYPAAPLYFLCSPLLAKGHLTPVMEYAASGKWPYPYAPHDIGTYPKANAQVYGMGNKDDGARMPVEESANMILLVAMVARLEGNSAYAHKYWPQLTQWADYLMKKGFDPENQLCTDDFAGHLAHNSNLSIKSILAIGAFGTLCAMEGNKDEAERHLKAARDMVPQWIKATDDGDHHRLAFDRPGSWSQKYNLVWDRLLGLNLFPAEVAKKEMAYYLKRQGPYGLPLDSRKAYTKLDWCLWTASLTGNRQDLEAIVAPLYDFANKTTSRVPLTDWFDTQTAKMSGFQHRSVVGGLYIPMLSESALVQKWRSRAK